MTVGAVLASAARRWPARTALVDDASGLSWSYEALWDACKAAGAHLRARALAPGDRVALLADAQPEYLFADYGAMAAGLVRVPLDPGLSAAELARQVEDAGARVLLAGASRAALARQLQTAAEVLALEELATAPGGAPLSVAGPPLDALASLNYTGGTSSEPKAVMLTQGNLGAILGSIVAARGTQPGEVMLNVRPLWPIAAVIVLAQLAAGGTVVLGGGFEPRRFVELLRRHRAQSTSLVPTHLVRLLRDVPAAELAALPDLRAIDVGAAAIPQDAFEALLAALGAKIGVLYGLTEASWSCYQPPRELEGPRGIREGRMRTVGRPVPGCELRIEKEDGTAASAGEAGEVLLRGAHVMAGYWNRPEPTREALRGGWFHTGDQGVLDAEGVLSITGRLKELIRTGGKSVTPEEVEGALCSYPGVAEAAVVGLPDAEWGEIVAAAVVAAKGAALSERDLAAHCATLLSPHKRPKRIRLVDTLPRSHYGKVQRAKLRALLGS